MKAITVNMNNSNTSSPNAARKANNPVNILILQTIQTQNIVLVEGSTDEGFYSRYVHKHKTTVKSVTCTGTLLNVQITQQQNLNIGASQFSSKKYIIFLVKKYQRQPGSNRNKNLYGIVDKDFNQNPNIQNIGYTDGRDLETTLLSVDYNNINAKFGKKYSKVTLDQSIQLAYTIGQLRLFCSKNQCTQGTWNFQKIKKIYQNANYINYSNGNYNLNIRGIAQDMNLSPTQIANFMVSNQTPQTIQPPTNLIMNCNGHDILNIYAYIRKCSAGWSNYERDLFRFFNKACFYNTNLYTCFFKRNKL